MIPESLAEQIGAVVNAFVALWCVVCLLVLLLNLYVKKPSTWRARVVVFMRNEISEFTVDVRSRWHLLACLRVGYLAKRYEFNDRRMTRTKHSDLFIGRVYRMQNQSRIPEKRRGV